MSEESFSGILFIVLNLALSFFVHNKKGLIIADSCFKSQEIDLENKVVDSKYTNRLLGYVLKKVNKGCLEVIFISELKQKETLGGSGLQIEQRTGKELDCR